MSLYVVTGGAGFIGSHLTETLLARGERVRVVDSLITGHERNLQPGAEFVRGDLADLDFARKGIEGADYVLHQAAIPSVPKSVQDPVSSNRANIDATLNVLVAARDAKVKRLVYAASSSAYGNAAALPKREDMGTNPLSPYALQKLVGEQYLLDLERLFADASKYAAPGFDLFLDYVHPTKPANLIVAQNAFDLLTHRVLKNQPAIDRFSYRDLPIAPNKEPYRDETDLGMKTGEITLAVINRQYETIVSESEAVIQQASGHQLTGANDPFLENCRPPEFAERYRVFWNYVDVQRRMILGLPVSQKEQQEASRHVDQFYEKWYPLGRY
jgi:hypothetical protein